MKTRLPREREVCNLSFFYTLSNYTHIVIYIYISSLHQQYTTTTDTIKTGEYCKDSYNDEGECMTLGTKGCKATEAYCVFEAFDVEGKCVPRSTENKAAAVEGDRCDEKSNENSKLCKAGLFCHDTYSICMKYPKAGEACIQRKCEEGAGCNYGMCTPIGSLPDFALASRDELCKSGVINDAYQCVPTYAQRDYSQQCLSNEDCKHVDEVCDTKTNRCTSSHQHAQLDLKACFGKHCSGKEEAECLTKCQAAVVKAMCSEKCLEHTENRTPYVLGDAAYSVDCKSLKLTKLEDNKCDIKPADVFTNCDAVFSYKKSSANSIAGNPTVLMATVTALIGALLFF